MNTKLKNEIIALAEKSTIEICGLMYASLDSVKIEPCQNIAVDSINGFEISIEDQMRVMKLGPLMGVYHSHPIGPSGFSEQDLAVAEETALPFYMYDLVSKTWNEYLPTTYSVILEGRHFYWGFDDCYGAARHYYRQTLGLYLHDYDRDDNFGPSKSNAILENFEKEGFISFDPQATTIQGHDALLFDISKRAPQHLGMFVSNQRMFHHSLHGLSRMELLDGRYLSHLQYILRHKTLV